MAYCAYTDIISLISKDTLLQLCDDDNVGDIVVSPPNTAYSNIVAAIAKADAKIDSYIDSRYALPLATVPDQVRDASADLALCNLYYRRRELDVPEGIERREKNVIAWLKDVQAGRASIPDLTEEVSDRGYVVSKTEDDRYFNDDLMDTY